MPPGSCLIDEAEYLETINFSVLKAHNTQLSLSKRVIAEDRLPKIANRIAGVDVSYSEGLAVSAVVVLDIPSFELLETQTAISEVKFPYIPTLLSFRELPPLMACIRKLRIRPHVFLVNGHGIAHPYRCGLASHLGLALGQPTIGIARNRLVGEYRRLADQIFLVQNNQIIGSIVMTKASSKPIFVSIGHLISLATATRIANKCVRNNRMPEPLLQAHKIASARSRKLFGSKSILSA